ncbi:hypothetical protein HPP92_022605 [Vanilla planifolia]|uniref:NAC domain-containing protein n=1 Tax=Vanilla planifolia TaxID=51239 RepID=A0A835PQG7_VANPL|nr:hypothetical protein HPP92_022886 [Vanilla planifolia]KAG0459477.1 hypothetical protein HPP92_022605 [Vanilla planifolia]
MDEPLCLPPGFRFHPTDDEIITHYLLEKVANSRFSAVAIGEANLNESEPWDLPRKAKMGEKEWFFFAHKDKKYPTGFRTNRATPTGYWKATGKDKEIFGRNGNLVGMKKTLVFHTGRAPKGMKTNWVMQEYRLEGTSNYFFNLNNTTKDEWAVCKVYHKKEPNLSTTHGGPERNSTSFMDDLLVDTHPFPPLSFSPHNDNTRNKANETQEVENEPSRARLLACPETMRSASSTSKEDPFSFRYYGNTEQSSNSIIGGSWETGVYTERDRKEMGNSHAYDDELLGFDSVWKCLFEHHNEC